MKTIDVNFQDSLFGSLLACNRKAPAPGTVVPKEWPTPSAGRCLIPEPGALSSGHQPGLRDSPTLGRVLMGDPPGSCLLKQPNCHHLQLLKWQNPTVWNNPVSPSVLSLPRGHIVVCVELVVFFLFWTSLWIWTLFTCALSLTKSFVKTVLWFSAWE